ncbi:MAG: hypothetical protein DCO96_03725 [Fluviicola sp. XM-24bin1]|nr:MAG: hypothetical protein DCO96_03725 [Fluviicola sp. XM-24bin1]
MTNFDNNTLEKLSSNSKELYETLSNADSWVESNLKYEDKESVLTKIKKTKSEVAKIQRTINSKPVFALFGISQVGKSYLAQSLLSSNGKPLRIKCGSENIDFLKEINPQGSGAESTGVVTRFSIEDAGFSEEYPIQVKLLSPKDLILIIADSFFSDISRLETYSSKEDFKLRIKEIQNEYSGKPKVQNFLNEDDLWDINKYFKENFNKFSYYVSEIESSGFWGEVGKIIEQIPPNDWCKVFELVWYRNDKLSSVFNKLTQTLELLSFSKKCFVAKEAVLRSEGAILDVQRLNDILGSSKELSVCFGNNQKQAIESALFCALVSELTLTIDKSLAENKEFLQNTDLLDFPGARSRESFLVEKINDEAVVKMFLRGKISYLFNKYSMDFEINNLLFCMKDEKIEVNELAGIVNDWIEKNIGPDPETREKSIGELGTSPLFVVLTFFNRQLDFDPINDNSDVSYKWDNRFRRFFEEQITFKYGWHTHWTSSNPNFSNFFLLRDFKFSNDTFISKDNIETEVREERKNHLKNLEESFLKYPFVQKHFTNPESAFKQAARINQDGSELIIDSLLPAANNFVKVKNSADRLNNNRVQVLTELSKYLVSDNLKEKRDTAFRKANDIQFSLLNLFSRPEFRFSDYLKGYFLSDTEVYNLVHENFLKSSRKDEPERYTIFKSMFKGISASKTRLENLQVIADKLKLDTPEAAEDYLDKNDFDLDEVLENRVYTSATKLVDSLIDLWKSKMAADNFEEFTLLGMEKRRITEFGDYLVETFESLHIRDELVEIYEQKTRLINSPASTQEYLSAISTNYFNDFVSNFGFNFMSKNRLDELFDLCKEYDEDVDLLKYPGRTVDQNELLSIYDTGETRKEDSVNPLVDNFRLYLLKMKLAMISNCGFSNYNVEENEKLSTIVNGLDQISFELTK